VFAEVIKLLKLFKKQFNKSSRSLYNNFHILLTFYRFLSYNDLLHLLSNNFNDCNNFVSLANTKLRLHAEDADGSKYVGVLINITDIYIYIYI